MRPVPGLALALVAVALCSVPPKARADTVGDQINDARSQQSFLDWCPECVSVGWYYTPQTSYELSGVQTRFTNNTDAPGLIERTVTVEILTERRAVGGTLLASAAFPSSDARGVFGGGTFAAPVGLVAGTRYFIGFRNVGGIGINTTADGNARNLGVFGLFLDSDGVDDGMYQSRGGLPFDGSSQDQPVLRLLQPVAPTGALPSPGSARALKISKALLSYKERALGDQLTFSGSFPGPPDAFDPVNGLALAIVQGQGTIVASLEVPAGQLVRKSRDLWKFKDAKNGSLGDPARVEGVTIRFEPGPRLYAVKVKMKGFDAVNPGGGPLTTVLALDAGAMTQMAQQEWRSVRGGKRLQTTR